MKYVRATAMLLAACAQEPTLEPGKYVEYDIYARPTSAILFDRLHVTLTREIRARPAPMTPTMIARGDTPPASYEVRSMIVFEDYVMPPTRFFRFEYDHELWQWGGLAVLAFADRELVAAGTTPLMLVNRGNRHWVAQGQLELRPAAVELWGVERSDGGPAWGPCIRIAGPVTQYITREIDNDCDLIYDWDDCQPDAYCPPGAPSSPTCGC